MTRSSCRDPAEQITAVHGSDGRYHVVYEFQLTKRRSIRRRWSGGGARRGPPAPVETLSAAEIIAGDMLHFADRLPATETTLDPNETAVLFIDLAFDKRRRIPSALEHRFTVGGISPFSHLPSQFRYVAGRVAVSEGRPPVQISPLAGKGWLASDGCCTTTGHVVAMYGLNGKLQATERFAADWIQIDPSGRTYSGDRSDPRSWVGYGAKIYATADGVVSKAVDNQQDQVPGSFPSALLFSQFPGNEVVITHADGFSSVFAHLKPGSVRVEAGDRVRAGQVIARLGNSGASAAPHLHYHVVNGRAGARADGYPYEVDSFKVAGTATREQLGAALQGEPAFPARDLLNPVRHRRELPMDFTINDFPSPR